jgi:hypothetical protein
LWKYNTETTVMSQTLNVDKDAFSSGQIGSKIWLCEELERLFDSVDHIAIYGGWYGVTAFLLNSRGNIDIGKIRSYDVDPSCEAVADMINENWVIQDWKFKAFTQDCNALDSHGADLVINTSTEHFESMEWWTAIPKGTVIAVQGNNMIHDDHHVHSTSLKEFTAQFPVTEKLYAGEKQFVYPDWQFTRYMLIGIK